MNAYYIRDEGTNFEAIRTYSNIPPDMHFADDQQCARYAEALTTFILLRKQPGSEAVKDERQYTIETENGDVLGIYPVTTEYWKFVCISPCFNSEEAARKAIETVGEERILNMFKYFHS